VRNPADWAEKYLGCVNVGVPACEKLLINWALARKITRLSSYENTTLDPANVPNASIRSTGYFRHFAENRIAEIW
jgi:hypothetical protein